MTIQTFTIEYSAKKPLFPVNRFQFVVNQEYAETNLKTLKGTLQLILGSLQFIPLDKGTIAQGKPICKRTVTIRL